MSGDGAFGAADVTNTGNLEIDVEVVLEFIDTVEVEVGETVAALAIRCLSSGA